MQTECRTLAAVLSIKNILWRKMLFIFSYYTGKERPSSYLKTHFLLNCIFSSQAKKNITVFHYLSTLAPTLNTLKEILNPVYIQPQYCYDLNQGCTTQISQRAIKMLNEYSRSGLIIFLSKKTLNKQNFGLCGSN